MRKKWITEIVDSISIQLLRRKTLLLQAITINYTFTIHTLRRYWLAKNKSRELTRTQCAEYHIRIYTCYYYYVN